jgi:single-strand DNA-binding protein
MARSVNKVILIGNLGKDAETKFTPGGRSRTTFTIATSRSWKDANTGEMREQTDWHNIVMWGQDRVGEYLKKGKQVFVEGRLTTRTYENNEGKTNYITEVVCDNLMLLGTGGGGGGGGDDSGYGGGYNRGERRGGDYGGQRGGGQGGGSQTGGGQRSNQPPDDDGFAASDDDIPF